MRNPEVIARPVIVTLIGQRRRSLVPRRLDRGKRRSSALHCEGHLIFSLGFIHLITVNR